MSGTRIPPEVVKAAGLIQARIEELKAQDGPILDGAGTSNSDRIAGLTEAQALLFRGAIEAP